MSQKKFNHTPINQVNQNGQLEKQIISGMANMILKIEAELSAQESLLEPKSQSLLKIYLSFLKEYRTITVSSLETKANHEADAMLKMLQQLEATTQTHTTIPPKSENGMMLNPEADKLRFEQKIHARNTITGINQGSELDKKSPINGLLMK